LASITFIYYSICYATHYKIVFSVAGLGRKMARSGESGVGSKSIMEEAAVI